jgi:hypothetical protein
MILSLQSYITKDPHKKTTQNSHSEFKSRFFCSDYKGQLAVNKFGNSFK